MKRLALPVLALGILSVACSAQSAAAPTSPGPAEQEPLAAASGAPAPSPTSEPSSTPTTQVSPTPMPDLKIQPSTLAQLRVRWSVGDPGKGVPFTFVTCQTNACDAPTRIGGYSFSRDGSQLAVGLCKGDLTENKADATQARYTCAGGGEVHLYQAATGTELGTLAVGGFPESIAFDPTGKQLAAGMSDGQVEIWDLAAGQRVQRLKHPVKYDGVTSVQYSGDGSLLLSQGNGKVLAWDPAKGTLLKTMDAYGAITPDHAGERMVVSWFDADSAAVIVRIFDLSHLGAFKDIRPRFVQPNMMYTLIRAAFTQGDQELLILGSNGAEWWDAQALTFKGKTDISKLTANKKDAFGPVGAVNPQGLVLTEPGFGFAIPGIPVPPSMMGGTPSCGFALWDPTSPGAFVAPMLAEGCPVGVIAGDSQRAVLSFDGLQAAADDGSGNLRVWAVDPTVAPTPPICLGKCPAS